MRSTLYANVLAHIFVTSLLIPYPPPRPVRKRRDTPYWPTTDAPSKAADILGIPGVGSAYPQTPKEDGYWNERVSRLAEVLRKSITRLISTMDPESFQGESEFIGLRAGFEPLFIKSLEEVVRSCEMSAYGYF